MAILGSHALALSKEDGHPFQAVRMVGSSSSQTTPALHEGWELVYSTPTISLPSGRHSLEAELSSLLGQLSEYGNNGNRGVKVHLCSDESRTWTVFDCGVVEHL